MVDLIFSNSDSSIRVVFRTDLLSQNIGKGDGLFTVMQVSGLDGNDAAQVIFGNYRELDYTLTAFKQLAITNNMTLIARPVGGNDNDVNAVAQLDVPGSFGATVNSATQITLNWTVVSGASGYTLDRSTASDFSANLQTFSLAATATSKVDTGLTTATHYYYRIKALSNSIDNIDSDYAEDDGITS